jgi:hypothetical protein
MSGQQSIAQRPRRAKIRQRQADMALRGCCTQLASNSLEQVDIGSRAAMAPRPSCKVMAESRRDIR